MFVRLDSFGRMGVIQDTVGQALASGTFTDVMNMRFTGVEMRKMLEPLLATPWNSTDGQPLWLEMWADGLSTYMAVATQTKLFFWADNGVDVGQWVDASRAEGYDEEGKWHSFPYGDTVIFNNGLDEPQIFNTTTQKFENLPRWGLISTAEDILNNSDPTRQVKASCTVLVPYKTFLVACGVTEDGLYQPNKVWWSDTSNLAGYNGAPNWDYETPASLSGQVDIDPESGAIRTAAQLSESVVIYTDAAATAMTFVGGRLVMQFRRLFNKGAAGLHTVAEFNNQHFVVSRDQIYLHDGSTVNLIAKDRVEEEFFKRIGKGGRFGDGSVGWDDIQVVKNPDRKEIMVVYGDYGACIPVAITLQPVNTAGTGGNAVFFVGTTGTATITFQWQQDNAGDGVFVDMEGETSNTLTVPDTSVNHYQVIVSNPCGQEESNEVYVSQPKFLRQSSDVYNGFNYKGMVVSNTDGSVIMFSHKGYGPLDVSRDGGLTWTSSQPMYNNTTYPNQTFAYDPNLDRWWINIYREATRANYFWYSDDDGVSWLSGHPQEGPYWGYHEFDYNHGFMLVDGGTVLVKQDSENNGDSAIQKYENLPAVAPWTAELTHAAQPKTSQSMWAICPLENDTLYLTTQIGQGAPFTPSSLRIIPSDFSGQGLNQPDSLGRADKVDSANGTWGISVHNSTGADSVNIIPINSTTGAGGNVNVTFDGPVVANHTRVAAGLGYFVLYGPDTNDRNILRFAYCSDTDLGTWTTLPSVTIPGLPVALTSVADAYYHQLYYSHGTTWMFAYVGDNGTSTGNGSLCSFELGLP